MRVITKRRLREFWRRHEDAEKPLKFWYKMAARADWNNLPDVKRDFSHADLAGNCTVFNVGGNKCRLIVKIIYRIKRVYIRFVLTHKEYDEEGWKDDCGC